MSAQPQIDLATPDQLSSDLLKLALTCRTLSPVGRDALRRAVAVARREDGLQRMCVLVDPEGRMSRWALKTELSRRLKRFQAGGYRRIAAGHRSPRGSMEEAMTAVLDCPGGISARRLLRSI